MAHPFLLLLLLQLILLSNAETNYPQITKSPPPTTTTTKSKNKHTFTLADQTKHSNNPQCPLSLSILFRTPVHSSIHSTPIIHPLVPSTSQSAVIASTFVEYLEIIEGDGYKPHSFPIAFESSTFQGSPVLFDVDGDGTEDVCIADVDGKVFWVSLGEDAEYLGDRSLKVPKLKVKKEWMNEVEIGVEMQYLSMFDQEHPSAVNEEARLRKRAEVKETLQQRPGGKTRPAMLPEQRRRLLGKEEEDKEEVDPNDLDAIDAANGIEPLEFSDDDAMHYVYNDDLGYENYHSDDDGSINESEYVSIDAHILTTPLVYDINNDGHADLVIAVSWFFDMAKYPDNPKLSNYVANGVLVYDLFAKDWLFQTHLDLTTAKSKHRAMIYSSPTIGDIDGDGRLEIIVGTSLGLIYVLDAATGEKKDNFPVQMGDVQAQVAIADITGSVDLELIVGDMEGNFVVLDSKGKTVWHRHISGIVTHPAVIGDVDGDGDLDVVIVSGVVETGAGAGGGIYVYAFDGRAGEDLEHFPMFFEGGASGVIPQALLVDLHQDAAFSSSLNVKKDEKASNPKLRKGNINSRESITKIYSNGGVGPGLHIVVPINGDVYIIEGSTGCSSNFNVGSKMYSMVLAGDVSGDNKIALIVGTMNGEVVAYETSVEAHPTNTWLSAMRGRLNGFVHGGSQTGIFAHPQSAAHRDVLGYEIPITFEIFDKREGVAESRPVYSVYITEGTSLKRSVFAKKYAEAGVYTVMIRLPSPGYTTLVLSMSNSQGLHYEHVFSIGYNVIFDKGLAWLVGIPAFFMAGFVFMFDRDTSYVGIEGEEEEELLR